VIALLVPIAAEHIGDVVGNRLAHDESLYTVTRAMSALGRKQTLDSLLRPALLIGNQQSPRPQVGLFQELRHCSSVP
jgi:hypothetical protein